jgi:hypothetical protein
MVRNRKRKTNRVQVLEEDMKRAVERVLAGEGVRRVALMEGINRQTLSRYVKKVRKSQNENREVTYTSSFATRQIFTPADEEILTEYLLESSRMCYGLTPADVRSLAYDLAVKNEKTIPESWQRDKKAGKDWLTGFLKSHRNLSIRSPEATSLSRVTSFNETNVKEFFDKLEEVMNRHQFPPQAIWNLDETGCTTVQKPCKVVAQTGLKQVAQVTSAERGTLVTVCSVINALGNFLPPAVIFPRVHFKNVMINGCPPGTLGLAKQSGWMTSDNFLLVLEHIVTHVKCSIASSVLLVMDNHETHVNIEVIDFCRRSGIVILTFPPHCSHRLQPLDRTVYGPFKKYYNSGCDRFMTNHPGQTMTIYDVGSVIGYAFPLAFTPTNILAGFRVTGICPFDRNIFTPADFMSSAVTNRKPPTASNTAAAPATDLNNTDAHPGELSPIVDDLQITESRSLDAAKQPESLADLVDLQPSCSSIVLQEEPSTSTTSPSGSFHPTEVRPYPKASERKINSRRAVRQGRTRILTDTPEKKEIESKGKKRPPSSKVQTKGKSLKKANPAPDSTDEDDDWPCLVCCEPFRTSKGREKWIQCVNCKKWAHEDCTDIVKGQVLYVCDNCRSDDEESD